MDHSWRERAACRGMGWEAFLPAEIHRGRFSAADAALIVAAKRVCAGCVVRVPCLAFALRSGEVGGVWGGHYLTERNRGGLLAELRDSIAA